MGITIDPGVTIGGGVLIAETNTIVPKVPHTVTGTGNARVSTTQVKFGTGSYTSNSTPGFLAVTPFADLAWGTGNFTMEFWYYPTNLATLQTLIGMRPKGVEGLYPNIYINTNGTVNWYISTANRLTSAVGALTANTWNSVAVVRSSGNTKMFINGTQSGPTYVDTNNYVAGNCLIGANDFTASGAYPVVGYLDEIRFSNVARYTGTYTPATEAFVPDNNTLLLIHSDGTANSTVFTDSSNTL